MQILNPLSPNSTAMYNEVECGGVNDDISMEDDNPANAHPLFSNPTYYGPIPVYNNNPFVEQMGGGWNFHQHISLTSLGSNTMEGHNSAHHCVEVTPSPFQPPTLQARSQSPDKDFFEGLNADTITKSKQAIDAADGVTVPTERAAAKQVTTTAGEEGAASAEPANSLLQELYHVEEFQSFGPPNGLSPFTTTLGTMLQSSGTPDPSLQVPTLYSSASNSNQLYLPLTHLLVLRLHPSTHLPKEEAIQPMPLFNNTKKSLQTCLQLSLLTHWTV
ncbi:hypothetical protein E4T56_gene3389 [Termitomyces sp. T112]|nr:hypothetical protein E4T56_gene3389 [Termitomyces sp. T112]